MLNNNYKQGYLLVADITIYNPSRGRWPVGQEVSSLYYRKLVLVDNVSLLISEESQTRPLYEEK